MLFLGASLSACGSLSGDACSRAAECNSLQGRSVAECTEDFERRLELLPSRERADCERSLSTCLEFSSCENFLACQLNCQ